MLFYFSQGKISTVPLFIVVLMLLYGISGTYQPAVQASVPLLVAKDKLMAGNAVINQVNTLSGLLGPVIGGVMFTLWGIYPILLLSAACFTFSAIMEIFIHIPHEKRPREVGVFRVVGMDLKESYQFVKTEKPIFFSVVFLVSIFNMIQRYLPGTDAEYHPARLPPHLLQQYGEVRYPSRPGGCRE